MPHVLHAGLCSECWIGDITPGKRKCRAHRSISHKKQSEPSRRIVSMTRQPLQEHDSNIFFRSSIWHQSTSPFHYQVNEQDDITLRPYKVPKERRKAFHKYVPQIRQSIRDQRQRETQRSPILNRTHHHNFTVFNNNLSSSPS